MSEVHVRSEERVMSELREGRGGSEPNARILVIDDEESVRDGIKAILEPPRSAHASELDAAAMALFGEAEPEAPAPARTLHFRVDTARNGREGIARVEASVAAGEPYAVIFCDMRMPGIDGLETVEGIRRFDRRAEVVFVTAYSDHSLPTITERVGANVVYFVKPFLTEEVRQLATKLVLEWNRGREVEGLIRTLVSLRGSFEDVQRLIQHFLEHLCEWLGTDSAMVIEVDPAGEPRFHAGVGAFSDPGAAPVAEALARHGRREAEPIAQRDGVVVLRVGDFGVAVAADGGPALDSSRRYLLEVFLENAAMAIRNSQMRSELAEKARLAAVGQALGFVVHDLGSHLGAIEMMVELLERGSTALGPPAAVYARIRETSARARALLGDTLDVCRGSKEATPREGALAAELGGLAAIWRLMLGERGIGLTLEVEEGARGQADWALLGRALTNLVNNASEALRGRPGAAIQVIGRARRGALEVTVRDNGPGIPEALRPRIFTPFVTGRREGTGFGLAIVKQIVEAHGGTIAVESGEGGTSFVIRLPG